MVHQSEDQLFKYATKEDGFGLLKLLKESNANIKEIDFKSENLTYNPTELIELDSKIYKTDMILDRPFNCINRIPVNNCKNNR